MEIEMTDARAASTLGRLEALNRRRGLFLWTTLGALVAAGAFVVGLPAVYRASALLLVRGAVPGVSAPEGLQAGIDNRLQTIKQEAFGRRRLSDLIDRFDLYGVSRGRMSRDRALERLQHDIRVEPTSTAQGLGGASQTLAFSVSYVGSSPAVAADVANALASFFVGQNDRMREAQASRVTDVLGAQLAETRRRLDGQEEKVRAYSSRNLGALPQQFEANLSAINRLDAQLRMRDGEQSKLIERRQSLKNDLATLAVQPPPEADDSPQAQVARLEHDLADLRMRFGETYPDVKAAKTKLANLRQEIASGRVRSRSPEAAGPSRRAVLQQALAEVEAQLHEIETEDARIKSQIADYQGRVESAPARAPAFDGLVRDYQATRDEYDGLQKRYNEAQLAARAERGDDTQEFRVLDAAVPPTIPAGPTRAVLFGLGVVIALLCGAGVVVAAEHLDTSFHSVDDLRQFTRVPVLASIPEIRTPAGTMRRLRVAVATSAALVAIAALAEGAFLMARSSDQVARLLSRVMCRSPPCSAARAASTIAPWCPCSDSRPARPSSSAASAIVSRPSRRRRVSAS
jgi:polysaccharide chain length determinant protein (PEP-CTERM system associated)